LSFILFFELILCQKQKTIKGDLRILLEKE